MASVVDRRLSGCEAMLGKASGSGRSLSDPPLSHAMPPLQIITKTAVSTELDSLTRQAIGSHFLSHPNTSFQLLELPRYFQLFPFFSLPSPFIGLSHLWIQP